MRKLGFVWGSWPLAVKLTLTTTLLVVVAVGSVTLLSINRERQTFRTELQQQAELLLDTLAAATIDQLYYLDTDSLSDIMEALGQGELLLTSGHIYDAEGRIIADAHEEEAAFSFERDPFGQQLVESDTPLFTWQPNQLLAGRAVGAGNQRFGAVSVGLPIAPLDAKVTIMRNQGLTVALVTILIGGGLAFLLSRSVTGRLKKLVNATKRIAEGDLTQEIAVGGNDELAALGAALEHMRAELQQLYLGLEKQVAERTAELTVANQQLQAEITERKQVEGALRERERFLILLNEITRVALETPDLPTMLQSLANRIGKLFVSDGCYLALWDEEAQKPIPGADCGSWPKIDRSLRAEPDQVTLIDSILKAGRPLVVEDVQDSPRLASFLTDRSLLGLPLIAGAQKLGAVLVSFNEPRHFTTDLISRGEQAAAQIALAVAKAQSVEALKENVVELQARNEELDAFAHTVAHDIKNPLGIVVGYAETLDQEWSTIPDETAQRLLRIIAQNGRWISNIVDELLFLASVRVMEEIETEMLDMGCIVAYAQERLHPLIEECQAEIILPDDWPKAAGYAPWLETVWANYISNALKYGGQPPRVELGAAVEPDSGSVPAVRFWVRDNGPGLSPEEQNSLFTPFERLYQVRIEGHGLGLSIVRRIVHKLGGEVGVESSGVPGQGSTFYFTLPGLVTSLG